MTNLIRTDIQVLRGLSVISVVLFHMGEGISAQGYLGVDVFFVISGFLISNSIFGDIRLGRFSIGEFYKRRILRIVPALYLVVILSFIFAWYRLMPEDFENFGQSVFASATFSNNFLLYFTTGYWDLSAEFKPLLHTWSLAVEEQFYLVFPVLIAFFARRNRNPDILIYGLSVLSLVAPVFFSFNPSAVFYFPFFRVWEIGVGYLCARMKNDSPGFSFSIPVGFIYLAWFFLASMLLFSIDFINEHTLPLQLFAVFFSLIIIFQEKVKFEDLFGALITKIFVFFGGISYSLYLVHQPVYAFLRASSIAPPKVNDYLIACSASIVASILLMKLVESPFRNYQRWRFKSVLMIYLVSTICLCGLGLFVHLNNGVPSRVFQIHYGQRVDQSIEYSNRILEIERNADTVDATSPEIIIYGDSFGRDFANVLIESGVVDFSEIAYRRHDYDPCSVSSDEYFIRYSQVKKPPLVVFAGSVYDYRCYRRDSLEFKKFGADFFVVGPKDFGYNLNVYSRVPIVDRDKIYNFVSDEINFGDTALKEAVASGRYISYLDVISDGRSSVRVFDDFGFLLSHDRRHLTRAGAVFISAALMQCGNCFGFAELRGKLLEDND